MNTLKEEEEVLYSLLDQVDQQFKRLKAEEFALLNKLRHTSDLPDPEPPAATLPAQEPVFTEESSELNLNVSQVLDELGRGGRNLKRGREVLEEEEKEEEENSS